MATGGKMEASVYDETYNITLCNVTFMLETDSYILNDYTLRILLALLVLIVFLLGILGNLFVVIAVILSKRLQTTTNIFVINLAVADFLTASLLPVHASTLLSQSSCYIPELLCQFVAAATLTTLGCSVVTLAMIAFQRFTVLYAILQQNPKFDNAFRVRNIVLMVSFTWVYPIILMCIIVPLEVGTLGYAVQYKVCAQNTDNRYSDYLTLTVSLLVQFPAFVVIIVCYIFIFKMFRRHQREMNAIMPPSTQRTFSTISEAITIVEDLSTDQSDPAVVNLAFDECDGASQVPPAKSKTEVKTVPNVAAVEMDGTNIAPSDESETSSGSVSKVAVDECDSARRAPPKDLDILSEPSDADLTNNELQKNRENLPKSLEAPLPDQSTNTSSSGSVRPRVHTGTRDIAREQQNTRFKQQRKITINLFIVVCVYTLCVMPSAIIYPIPSTGPAIPWITILFLFNSCVNPIIYALRHPTFSEVLKCMMKCKFKDIPEPSSFLRTSSLS